MLSCSLLSQNFGEFNMWLAAVNGRYLYAPSGSQFSLSENLKRFLYYYYIIPPYSLFIITCHVLIGLFVSVIYRSPIMPGSSLEETKIVENDENVDPLGMKKDHHLANSKDQPRKNKRRKNRTRTKAAVAATWNEEGWLTPKSIPIC